MDDNDNDEEDGTETKASTACKPQRRVKLCARDQRQNVRFVVRRDTVAPRNRTRIQCAIHKAATGKASGVFEGLLVLVL